MEYIPVVLLAFLWFLVELVLLIQGPPFVKSSSEFESLLLEQIKEYSPSKILELGSGDGKLVVALAKKGYKVIGVELNPFLVRRSRKYIAKEHLEKNAQIVWKSFWSFDTSSFDAVVIYGVKYIMPKLEKKLTKELPKNAVIISNFFEFPNLKTYLRKGVMKVYKI